MSGREGLQLFDIRNKKSTFLSNKVHQSMAISRDRRFVLTSECDEQGSDALIGCKVVRIDLESNDRTVLASFGDGDAIALDPTDQILLTGSVRDGLLRVGRLSGEEPHILFGGGPSVGFSPDGSWIASKSGDGKIRLIPMPDLSRHTLPHDQFLAKLKTFTNLRVVSDPNSSTGWKLEVGPFPGWQEVPGW
jgi:WD40 repeat protein